MWSHLHYTEKSSSQQHLLHSWPPTTISETGKLHWRHSMRQTILDPTQWDGHQIAINVQEMSRPDATKAWFAPTVNTLALHGTPTLWTTYSNWKQYKGMPPVLSVDTTTLQAVFHTWLVLHRKPCICDNFWSVKCKVLHFYVKNKWPVELWNQLNATSVQSKHCQT